LHGPGLPLAEPKQLCLAVGELLGKTMGGSSGVLMSIFFTAVGAALERLNNNWHRAFEAGIEAMQHYGGAKAGDRTMLDALIPAISALKAGDIRAAANAAQAGANATAEMTKAHAGRSSYVNAKNLMGV